MANWKLSGSLLSFALVTGLTVSVLKSSSGRPTRPTADHVSAPASSPATSRPRSTRFIAPLQQRDGTESIVRSPVGVGQEDRVKVGPQSTVAVAARHSGPYSNSASARSALRFDELDPNRAFPLWGGCQHADSIEGAVCVESTKSG